MAEWEAYAKSAGISDLADIGNFGRFMENEPSTGGGSGSLGHSRIADALVATGLTINSEQRAAIEATFIAVQSGETHLQCTAVQCIFLVYLGRIGTEDDVAWLEPQLKSAIRADEARAGGGAMEVRASTIDLKGMPSYGVMWYYRIHLDGLIIWIMDSLYVHT